MGPLLVLCGNWLTPVPIVIFKNSYRYIKPLPGVVSDERGLAERGNIRPPKGNNVPIGGFCVFREVIEI